MPFFTDNSATLLGNWNTTFGNIFRHGGVRPPVGSPVVVAPSSASPTKPKFQDLIADKPGLNFHQKFKDTAGNLVPLTRIDESFAPPEAIDWKKYLPWIGVGGVVLLIASR